MNPSNRISPVFGFLKTATILLLLMSSCKSDEDSELPQVILPEFGTCDAVNPRGNLSFEGLNNERIIYSTDGGGHIEYQLETGNFIFSHADYPGFKIEFWGGNLSTKTFTAVHENLNGKHIKDKLGNRRSIIFPDGTKLTHTSETNSGPLQWISIYEGNAVHRINLSCNTLEYSSENSTYATQLDNEEPDGETATFEITETGLLFLNIYNENAAGQKVEERVPLGELFRDTPSRVQDHYDDPRITYT